MPFKKGVVTNPKGRSVGSKNKFTLLKRDIIDVWHQNGGKKKLRAMFNNPKTFLKVVDQMISILPKEPLIDSSTHITQVKYEWNTNNQDTVQPPTVSIRDSQSSSEIQGSEDRAAGREDGIVN